MTIYISQYQELLPCTGNEFWGPASLYKNFAIHTFEVCNRALEYIAVAREEGGGEIYSSFIAFKVHLTMSNATGACTELSSIVAAADFTPDFLTVSKTS